MNNRVADRLSNAKKAALSVAVWAGIACLGCLSLSAAEHHGQVRFGGLPVPGATVSAVQGGNRIATITDPEGKYSFPDLADGAWSIQVEMLCFSTARQDVTVAAGAPGTDFELKLLPLGEINAQAKAAPAPRQLPAPAAAQDAVPGGRAPSKSPPRQAGSANPKAESEARPGTGKQDSYQ